MVDSPFLLATTGVAVRNRDELNYAFRVTTARVETPAIMGEILCPLPLSNPALPVRSESFVRKRAIFKVVPIYHSAGHPQNGDAVVRIVIDEDGTVDSAECISGNHLIGQLAEEAALRWKFEPILVNGQPARVESRLTFHVGT